MTSPMLFLLSLALYITSAILIAHAAWTGGLLLCIALIGMAVAIAYNDEE